MDQLAGLLSEKIKVTYKNTRGAQSKGLKNISTTANSTIQEYWNSSSGCFHDLYINAPRNILDPSQIKPDTYST
jgi:hypothetical protein